MKYRIWTEEETSMLLEMAKAGKPIDDILKVFPYRTENSIRSLANKHGISATSYGKPEINYEAFKKIMKGGQQKCL
jgi:hypothetical protein